MDVQARRASLAPPGARTAAGGLAAPVRPAPRGTLSTGPPGVLTCAGAGRSPPGKSCGRRPLRGGIAAAAPWRRSPRSGSNRRGSVCIRCRSGRMAARGLLPGVRMDGSMHPAMDASARAPPRHLPVVGAAAGCPVARDARRGGSRMPGGARCPGIDSPGWPNRMPRDRRGGRPRTRLAAGCCRTGSTATYPSSGPGSSGRHVQSMGAGAGTVGGNGAGPVRLPWPGQAGPRIGGGGPGLARRGGGMMR